MAGAQDRPTDYHPDYGNPQKGTLVSSSPPQAYGAVPTGFWDCERLCGGRFRLFGFELSGMAWAFRVRV